MGSKGAATKLSILEHAIGMATSIGLGGLSIGQLASELKLSKSGLFAHFHSKEALQIQVLQLAAEKFEEQVIKPALKAKRGAPRLTALFDLWLRWGQGRYAKGNGCVFVAAAAELDDQPGPVRDQLVRIQSAFVGVMAQIVRQGAEEKAFSGALEPERVAQELYGIMLSFHLFDRLLRDPQAEARARAAFAELLSRLVTA